MFELSIQKVDWQKAIEDLSVEVSQEIKLVLEAVLAEVIPYLQSYIGTTDPLGRGRIGQFHPGGWRDITGAMAKAYGGNVEQVAGGWRLNLVNTDYRSVFLEARHGMFILEGVAGPGGPVEKALVAAAAKLAPGWIVAVRW